MIGGDFFELPKELRVPKKLLAFVNVHRDPEGHPIPLGRLSRAFRSRLERSGWKFFPREQDLSITLTDAQRLAEQPGGFTQALIDWLEPRTREALEILKQFL
jgi:hypothetical protein